MKENFSGNDHPTEKIVRRPGENPVIMDSKNLTKSYLDATGSTILGEPVSLQPVEQIIKKQIRRLEIDSWYDRLKFMKAWVENEFELLKLVRLVERGEEIRPPDMPLDRWNNFIARHQRLIHFYSFAIEMRNRYPDNEHEFMKALKQRFPELL
jgi:hypothetical protein